MLVIVLVLVLDLWRWLAKGPSTSTSTSTMGIPLGGVRQPVTGRHSRFLIVLVVVVVLVLLGGEDIEGDQRTSTITGEEGRPRGRGRSGDHAVWSGEDGANGHFCRFRPLR